MLNRQYIEMNVKGASTFTGLGSAVIKFYIGYCYA